VSVFSSPPERFLCDTSFVGASAKRAARPERFAHWPVDALVRIDSAILAISIITLAEARYGYLNANWGTARIDREERRLAGFLQIPLDPSIVDEWARLRVLSKQTVGTSPTTTCGSPPPPPHAAIRWSPAMPIRLGSLTRPSKCFSSQCRAERGECIFRSA